MDRNSKIPRAANQRLVCTDGKARGQVARRFLLLQRLLMPVPPDNITDIKEAVSGMWCGGQHLLLIENF